MWSGEGREELEAKGERSGLGKRATMTVRSLSLP